MVVVFASNVRGRWRPMLVRGHSTRIPQYSYPPARLSSPPRIYNTKQNATQFMHTNEPLQIKTTDLFPCTSSNTLFCAKNALRAVFRGFQMVKPLSFKIYLPIVQYVICQDWATPKYTRNALCWGCWSQSVWLLHYLRVWDAENVGPYLAHSYLLIIFHIFEVSNTLCIFIKTRIHLFNIETFYE